MEVTVPETVWVMDCWPTVTVMLRKKGTCYFSME